MQPQIYLRFTMLLLLIGFISCNKTTECECRKSGERDVNVSYPIKERNKKKAVEKCNSYSALPENDGKNLSCSLRGEL